MDNKTGALDRLVLWISLVELIHNSSLNNVGKIYLTCQSMKMTNTIVQHYLQGAAKKNDPTPKMW